MGEDAASERPQVVLGFDAAWGFASADQTSPALAGAAGALPDVTLTKEPVTELRLHGVSGSSGPTMLEHPQALQVAGDGVTGFYRRWSPDGPGRLSVPWKLEAYSWGGLTEAPLASASWLLMAPFMMYNVAYFMLPPEPSDGNPAIMDEPVPHLYRDMGHWVAGLLLRLLALAATVQFVSSAASVLISTVAWQVGRLPSWMGWYAGWTAGWRVAAALAMVAVIIAALSWISVTTTAKYEARISTARTALNAAWPLTQPGFWRGEALVNRQRALHTAAACASAALIAALPGGHPAAARWVAITLAAAVLTAAALSILSPLADRHAVTLAQGGRPQGGGADIWCQGVLAAALAALLTSAAVSGWTDRRHGPQAGALPGLTGFLLALLAVQAVLLGVLTVSVVVLARRARAGSSEENVPSYLGGGLAALVALLGFLLGGLLTAAVNFGVTRLLGTPVPSGFRFAIAKPDALVVPWPVYAFGAAPAGLLGGAVVAAILLFRRYRRRRAAFQTPAGSRPSPAAEAYAAATAGAGRGDGDDLAYARNRGAIASAWAVGLIIDDAAAAAALVAIGGLLVLLAAELAAAVAAGSAGHLTLLAGWWHGLATLVAVIAVVVVGWLVTVLRQAFSEPAKRKTIGALWDVATFWPRAVHPLAPPCYAERTVPEVVDRIRLLTGRFTNEPDDVANLHAQAGELDLSRTSSLAVPPGPVLLTGYSQGSVIASAVIAQLPPDVLPRVALLTLACPARRLYGRAFPAYFSRRQLAALAGLLNARTPGEPPAPDQPPGRWKNLCRSSDYIGSWVFAQPPPQLGDADLKHQVDQPCRDPVILVPDENPTPPPTHRHSQWWQDPRTGEVGAYLVGLLARPVRADPPPGTERPAATQDRVGAQLRGAGADPPARLKRSSIIGLLTVAAMALGLTPAALALHRSWLLPYLLGGSVIVVALAVRRFRFSSPTRATVPEFLFAGLDSAYLPALLGDVWLALYAITLWTVRLINKASGSHGDAQLIALAVSLSIVATVGVGVAWFITRHIGFGLYPRWGGSRTKYFYMTLPSRGLAAAGISALVMVVAVVGVARATSSWSSTGVWVAILLFVTVASIAAKPLPERSMPDDAGIEDVQVICEALAERGHRVVAYPRTGDPAVDPFVRQLDLFSYSEERAYAIEIRQGSPDAEPVDWTAGANVLEAARALARAKLTETSATIRPLIVVFDAGVHESLLEFCRDTDVSLIRVDRVTDTCEVVGSDENELQAIARRFQELAGRRQGPENAQRGAA